METWTATRRTKVCTADRGPAREPAAPDSPL